MKRAFTLALFSVVLISLMIPPTVPAAEQKPQSITRIEKNSDVWEFVLQPGFDEIDRSRFGDYIYAKKGKYWGVYDLDGTVIIRPDTYTEKVRFSKDGFGVVEKDVGGKSVRFYIDRNGKKAFPENYKFAGVFIDGIAFVRTDEGTTFIDTTGKRITQVYPKANFFSNGLAEVCTAEGKWGYINTKGKVVIKPQFKKSTKFSDEGLAAVQLDNGMYGYIDKKGTFVVPAEFTYAAPFSHGYALVSKDPKEKNREYYFIDPKGNEAFGGLKSLAKNSFKNGLAVIAQMKDVKVVGERTQKLPLYGAINTTGEIVIPLKYDKMEDFDGSGIAKADAPPKFFKGGGGQYRKGISRDGYVNKKGKWATMWHLLKTAEPEDPLPNRLDTELGTKLPGEEKGRWGYLDMSTGKMVIPAQFTYAKDFGGELASVQVGDKWGVIRLKGQAKQPQKAVSKKSGAAKQAIPEKLAASSISGENLLKNPGFEKAKKSNAKGQVPDGWRKYWTPRIDSGESHSGQRGLKIGNNPKKTSPYNNVDGILQDFKPPLPKDDYTMSCWLRSESGPLKIRMGMSDGSFKVPGSSKSFTIDEEWKKYEYSDNTSPARVHICLVGEPGTFYIDDCVLVKNSPALANVDDVVEVAGATPAFESDFEIRLITRDTPVSEGKLPSGIAVFTAKDISDVALDHTADGKPSIIIVLNEKAKKRLLGIASVSAGDTLVIITGDRTLAEYKITEEVPQGVFRIDNNYSDTEAQKLKGALWLAIFGKTSEN